MKKNIFSICLLMLFIFLGITVVGCSKSDESNVDYEKLKIKLPCKNCSIQDLHIEKKSIYLIYVNNNKLFFSEKQKQSQNWNVVDLSKIINIEVDDYTYYDCKSYDANNIFISVGNEKTDVTRYFHIVSNQNIYEIDVSLPPLDNNNLEYTYVQDDYNLKNELTSFVYINPQNILAIDYNGKIYQLNLKNNLCSEIKNKKDSYYNISKVRDKVALFTLNSMECYNISKNKLIKLKQDYFVKNVNKEMQKLEKMFEKNEVNSAILLMSVINDYSGIVSKNGIKLYKGKNVIYNINEDNILKNDSNFLKNFCLVNKKEFYILYENTDGSNLLYKYNVK